MAQGTTPPGRAECCVCVRPLVDPACSGNAGSKRWKPVARHARRSLTWPTASAPRRFGDERASPFSPHDVLEHGFVQGQVCDQSLQPLVLILELLEPSASRGDRRKMAGRSARHMPGPVGADRQRLVIEVEDRGVQLPALLAAADPDMDDGAWPSLQHEGETLRRHDRRRRAIDVGLVRDVEGCRSAQLSLLGGVDRRRIAAPVVEADAGVPAVPL
jgi:hypothetical protein